MKRLILALLLLIANSVEAGSDAFDVTYPQVEPGRPLAFPRDRGAHPRFRTEWWYVTGRLVGEDGRQFGFQITFFRSRPPRDSRNPSRFAPRQLLFAHAALTDAASGRLFHAQRAAREGFGLAAAAEGDTDVRLHDWRLALEGQSYRARASADDFELDLSLTPTQGPLAQGDRGYSRKGPDPLDASYYYSQPQLSAKGAVVVRGKRFAVAGRAWLDHEWSSRYLNQRAAGWDWAGINLADGGALMVFRIRDKAGGTLWAAATRRSADGTTRTYAPEEVRVEPVRRWTSPRTGARYPVEVAVTLPDFAVRLTPLLDDQELDARATTGTVYWEGAVDASQGAVAVGQGYLELTGYGKALRF